MLSSAAGVCRIAAPLVVSRTNWRCLSHRCYLRDASPSRTRRFADEMVSETVCMRLNPAKPVIRHDGLHAEALDCANRASALAQFLGDSITHALEAPGVRDPATGKTPPSQGRPDSEQQRLPESVNENLIVGIEEAIGKLGRIAIAVGDGRAHSSAGCRRSYPLRPASSRSTQASC
jgi:hypothetical protein